MKNADQSTTTHARCAGISLRTKPAAIRHGRGLAWCCFAGVVLSVFVNAAPCLAARVIAVSPAGSDQAAGTESAPFLTLGKAISASAAWDTVRIAPGEYDCGGFSGEVNHPLAITGSGKDKTVLKNFGALKFTQTLRVKDLAFTDSPGPVLVPFAAEGAKLENVLIENCAFINVSRGIDTDDVCRGIITDFTVRLCDFKNMKGAKVLGIAITSGVISKVAITDNTFQNLESATKICTAIAVGGNKTRGTTRDIIISGNRMEGIVGPVKTAAASGAETHGILAYGEQIQILKNTIKGVNAGGDHEAIYLKASNSLIAENVLEECSSDQGDIGIKGAEETHDNVIRDNRIFGRGRGLGIYAHGSVTVKGNGVKKPNGEFGIRIYACQKPVVIEGNYVEARENSVRISDAVDAVITGNRLVSLNREAIDLTGSCKVKQMENNKTHKGPNPPADWQRLK